MIVHFIASMSELEDSAGNLRKVTKILQAKGHVLARDWIDQAVEEKGAKKPTETSWQSITEENFEAIAKSDIVIADISQDSTGLGYQIATAVHQKKPTLLLLQEGRDVPPFTWNIPSTFLSRVEYTSDNLEEKLTPFLQDNDIATKDMRFNFFIDRPIYNYLRWSALKTGKTKAEVLRELVQREIERKDY